MASNSKKSPKKTLSEYPDIWKKRVLAFVCRLDSDIKLKEWCEEQGLNYSSARDWINEDAIKQATLDIGEMSGFVDSADIDLVSCSIREISKKIEEAREAEKKRVPSAYMSILPPEEQEVYQSLRSVGLDLREEIAFCRLQIHRAKRNQVTQDNLIKTGRAQDSLGLAEISDKDEESEDSDGPSSKISSSTKKAFVDWDKVIQRLGQLLNSFVATQIKLEYGENLTSNERKDAIARVLKRVSSEQISALDAGFILSSVGIERLPLPLELKIKEELSLYEPPVSTDPGVNRDQVNQEAKKLKAKQAAEKEAFLEERNKQLDAVIKRSKEEG